MRHRQCPGRQKKIWAHRLERPRHQTPKSHAKQEGEKPCDGYQQGRYSFGHQETGQSSRHRFNDKNLDTRAKQVFEKWYILPPFQHVYHNGIELKENSDVIGELGILTDDKIYIVADEEPAEDVEEIIDDEGEDAEFKRACAQSLAGFNGTALFGLPANCDSTAAKEGNGARSEMIVDDCAIVIAEDDSVRSK